MKICKTKNDLKQIKHGDYLCGIELVGENTKRKIYGVWTSNNEIYNNNIFLAMNDGYDGHRGNDISLNYGDIIIIEPTDDDYDSKFVSLVLERYSKMNR